MVRGEETKLVYSVPEAAEVLGIGRTLMWQLVRAGEVPSLRLARRVLVTRGALEEWLEAQSRRAS